MNNETSHTFWCPVINFSIIKALMELLEKSHLDVNAIDPNLGHAPIHSMVTAERPDKLECLLSLLIHGDVDLDLSRTADGKTALHLAAEVHVRIKSCMFNFVGMVNM